MNNLLKVILLGLTVNVATGYAEDTTAKTYDIKVDTTLANKTVRFSVTSNYPSDIIITQISQFTNNGDACAISTNQYSIKPNTEQPIFPFSSKDQSICFSKVHLFERYSNGTYPAVLGFYDPTDPSKISVLKDYLSDWSSYIVTPVVFKVSYTYQNIANQKGVVKYFVYRVNE